MKVFLGVTGASGSIYAQTLAEKILPHVDRLYLSATEAGKKVSSFELQKTKSKEFYLPTILEGHIPEPFKNKIRLFEEKNLFAPVASGSNAPDAMVILPCSMGTLSRIAHGASSNLIERAADVVLKQKRRLILCPRETPLNLIHLKNMVALSEAGAVICPPMPAFYQFPESVDDLVNFVVGRVLELLDINHDLYAKWANNLV